MLSKNRDLDHQFAEKQGESLKNTTLSVLSRFNKRVEEMVQKYKDRKLLLEELKQREYQAEFLQKQQLIVEELPKRPLVIRSLQKDLHNPLYSQIVEGSATEKDEEGRSKTEMGIY